MKRILIIVLISVLNPFSRSLLDLTFVCLVDFTRCSALNHIAFTRRFAIRLVGFFISRRLYSMFYF